MLSIGVGQFKTKCLTLLKQVDTKKEKILITKHGRPIAEVIPIRKKKKEDAMKKLRGTLLFEKDIVSPVGEVWEADQ